MTGGAYLLLSSLKSGRLTMQFALRRNSCIKKNKSTVTGWCSGSGLCFAIEWSELHTHMTAWTTLLKCMQLPPIDSYERLVAGVY